MATVTLRGLTKRFGMTRAVEELDLSVKDSEFFVLLGPSGAGKTTTLTSHRGTRAARRRADPAWR